MLCTKEEKLSGTRKPYFDISSAALHIIAMLSMLIDHTMKNVLEIDSWVFVLGRLAFPIFAFMAAEGYFHTHSYRKYILRLFVFAVISEVPYDLMKSGTIFDTYDQNVLWTFLFALLCIRLIDFVKAKQKMWAYILTAVVVSLIGLAVGSLSYVDYGGMGVLMVLIFYFFHERKWWCMLAQFILLFLINVFMLGALSPVILVSVFGLQSEIPLQGFAVFSLIPIWMYHGRQGHHSRPFQYACYAFYPVHMIILSVIAGGCA
jgi:hypothetical protein